MIRSAGTTTANNTTSDRESEKASAGRDPVNLLAGWNRIARDGLSLAGLQAQLIALDGKLWLNRVKWCLGLLIVSVIATLSSLPILLVAAAVGLNELGLPFGWAFLSVGGTVFIIAAMIGVVALNRVFQSIMIFERSQQELARNVEWIQKRFAESPEHGPAS